MMTAATAIESTVMPASVKTAVMASASVVMVMTVVRVVMPAGIRASRISEHPEPAVGGTGVASATVFPAIAKFNDGKHNRGNHQHRDDELHIWFQLGLRCILSKHCAER